ncbi:relaxase [Mucilaginibacter conchicola]|uniref:Relaxase n=1 Tax=Mucilaginibacter conchicola TaxID=2303333 RepID=A0A372NUJ8_9SPHI|nr:relaxase/mobilization nuclease domain-containing protein [Mucilaginibacter conchicola]RFZ92940.1 relaxase [Mucilaginibacter conchicola]
MVAVIHQSKHLRIALNYNEHKVKNGQAVCLEAGYYPVGPEHLSFHQKLRRLELLAELNQRTKHNCLHVSLNFDPSENLSDERLREIAAVYLEKIGFAGQPYLLYKHEDAGHPHLHLVTTNIKPDGSAIRMNYLGRDQSEPARKDIEQLFGLVVADKQQKRQVFQVQPVNAAKVLYGKTETKQAINNVLVKVLAQYKYASLAELNAVLRQYNIVADRGDEKSRIFKYSGLVYRVLDEQGNKVGVPVKASLFFAKPTLKFLTEKFEANKLAKDEPKAKLRLKNVIDLYLLNGPKTLDGLMAHLKTKGIDMVLRYNEQGILYGVTYVDHYSKCVFNGSVLGKAYSANAIRERCLKTGADEGKKQNGRMAKLARDGQGTRGKTREDRPGIFDAVGGYQGQGLVETLLDTSGTAEVMDWDLKRTKKKKKKVRMSM